MLLEYAHGGKEWVMLNLVQEALLLMNDQDQDLWAIKRIILHEKKKNKIMLHVEWDNGDITWEPLSTLRKDDPITTA